MATFANGESGLSVRTKINNVLQHADGTAGELVINDAGADVDFRVESDTNAKAFFVDGATGNVGLGGDGLAGTFPIAALDVTGNYRLPARLQLVGGYGEIIRLGRSGADEGASIFYPGSSIFAINTNTQERMRIDASGNVGIGTTTVRSTLHINSSYGGAPTNATGSPANSVRIRSTATAAAGVGPSILFDGESGNATTPYGFAAIKGFKESANAENYAGTLAFYTQTTGGETILTERMRITAAGDVGIGTISPVSKLSVAGNILAPTFDTNTTYSIGIQDAPANIYSATKRASLRIQASSAATGAQSMGGGDLTLKAGDSNSSTLNIDGDVNIIAGYSLVNPTFSRGSVIFRTNNTERMRVDASGNVGIGDAPLAWAASYKALSIASGYATIASNGANRIQMGSNNYNDGTNFIYGASSFAARYDQVLGVHSWHIAPSGTAGAAITFTQAMTLDASGRLVIGTTATPQISAGGIGTVSAIALSASGTAVVASMPASATGGGIRSQTVTAASTSWYHLNGSSGNGSTLTTNNIFIYGNGDVQNANNSYGAISDAKLKENIADASPKLEKLMQVRVRSYNLKGDYDQHKQIGVVAQELETVFPSMIEETQDRDLDGNSLETTTKSVKYSVFVPMLIKALQEQQVMIADLKARLDAANL